MDTVDNSNSAWLLGNPDFGARRRIRRWRRLEAHLSLQGVAVAPDRPLPASDRGRASPGGYQPRAPWGIIHRVRWEHPCRSKRFQGRVFHSYIGVAAVLMTCPPLLAAPSSHASCPRQPLPGVTP